MLFRKSGGINLEKWDELVSSVQRNRDQTIEVFGGVAGSVFDFSQFTGRYVGPLTLRLSLQKPLARPRKTPHMREGPREHEHQIVKVTPFTKPEEQARVHSRLSLVCLSQSPMG